MCKYKIFMLGSSITPIRPFVELTKQLEKKINVKVYILCDDWVEYERIIRENNLQCDEITFITLGNCGGKSGNINLQAESAAKGFYEKLTDRRNCLYRIWRKLYKQSQMVKLIVDVKDIVKIIRGGLKKRREVEKYFKKYKPDLVLLYSDLRMGSHEAQAIYLAAQYNIPRMIAPIAVLGKGEDHVRMGGWCYRKREADRFSILEGYLYRKYPGTWIRVEDIIAFRYDPCEIMAYSLMGILPINPWVVGTGDVTFTALISQKDYEYAVSIMGETYTRKAEVTHTIEETDIMIQLERRESIQNDFVLKYKIDSYMIVCLALSPCSISSFPIDYEKEKRINIRLITELVSVFGKVVVSLHPQMPKEEYSYFENISGCIVAKEPLYKIVPICDAVICLSISSIWEMVKNLNIHKIYLPLELYLGEQLDKEVNSIKNEAFAVKDKGKVEVVYKKDTKKDFCNLVKEELDRIRI